MKSTRRDFASVFGLDVNYFAQLKDSIVCEYSNKSVKMAVGLGQRFLMKIVKNESMKTYVQYCIWSYLRIVLTFMRQGPVSIYKSARRNFTTNWSFRIALKFMDGEFSS